MTVLPFGKSSIISGAMLGLGRALGETMAVTIILSVSGVVTFNLISQANPSTIAANIALDFPESSGLAINALIATGLVLFAITLVTNMAARVIVINRQNRRLQGEMPTASVATRGVDPAVLSPGAPCALVPKRSARDLLLVARVEGTRADRGHADRRRVRAGDAAADLAALRGRQARHPGTQPEFFTESARGVINGGGAEHAIVGTLVITGVAALISVPIGIMAAIYLNEYGTGKLRKALTFFVDVMTGIPSIVAGLFAYALFEIFFGPGIRLGVMGSVALSVLMIPIVIRSAEEVLKIVPNHLREAAYALGTPKWKTITKVVLPTAFAGLVTGVMLADRADHRRDRAAAGHDRGDRLAQLRPLQRPHAEPRRLRLQRVPLAGGDETGVL